MANDNLELIADFLSNNPAWEIEHELFSDVNYFFESKYNTSSLFFYSFSPASWSKSDSEKRLTRRIWTASKENRSFDNDDISNVIDKIISQNEEENGQLFKCKDDGDLYCFQVGSSEKQIYLALVEDKSGALAKVDLDNFKYLVNFIKNSFGCIQKWKHLSNDSKLAHIDDVTGLYNQRRLQKDLDTCIEKYNIHGNGFVVLFIDIDHFKDVNDGHGHLVGTRLLSELGDILRDVLRESDLIYRYGGDEFVMIVPNVNISNGKIIGERILSGVLSKKFKIDDQEEFKISVSIGVASFPKDAKTSKEVLSIADQMMYYAKSKGRSRVCDASELLNKE